MATPFDVILHFGMNDDISDGAKGIQNSILGMGRSSMSVIDGLAYSFNTLDSTIQGIIGGIAGKSLMDLTIGNASNAETGKVLLQNVMGEASQTTQAFQEMYHHIDTLTDESLVSLNSLMPAMANFKSATGATNDELKSSSDTLANFGSYVLAITGSEAKAETAMNDLSKGIKGQFAALDQYKLSEQALMDTGLWSGKEDDVEGYLAAVDQVIGKTDELMETNEGLDAKLKKAFSREGKAIGNELLPGLKEAKKAFLEWNEAADGKPAKYILLASSALSGFTQAMGAVGTTMNALKSLKDAWEVIRTKIMAAKEAEEAFVATEEMQDKMPTSGGGKNKTGGGKPDNRTWKQKNIDNLKDVGTSTIKNAAQIASAMFLVTEAIILIQGPMLALAATGMVYSAIEPQVKKGIEGINAIAGIMAMLLPPIIGLMVVMEKSKVNMENIVSGFKSAAEGIALGILLVTEAIALMVLPMVSLALVGVVYSVLGESNVQNGIKGIQAVSGALTALAPWIGIFAICILACMTPVTMAIGAVAGAAGIALGIGLVTEAIMGMKIPLEKLSQLGKDFNTQMGDIRKGTEAVKRAGQALKIISDAFASIASIAVSDLQTWIASGFKSSVDKLKEITADDGLINSLKEFASKFNEQTTGIVQVDMTGVNAIKTTADAVKSINEVLKQVKEVVSNLQTGESSGGTTHAVAEERRNNGGYFKNALEEVKTAAKEIADFNQQLSTITIEKIDESKLQALVSTSNGITKIKETVDKVKTAIQGIGQAGVAAAANNGGGIGKTIAEATGGNNSIRPALQQLLTALDDIIWFNQQVQSKITNLGNAGNVSNATNAISAISSFIKQISAALSNASTTMNSKGKTIGESIKKGIKNGIGNLSATITPTFNTAIRGLEGSARTGGTNIGTRIKDGYTNTVKGITQATQTEINHALTALNNAKQQFYAAGAELGRQLTSGFESTDGIDRGSPGKVARFTADEMNYTRDAIIDGSSRAYMAAQRLGRSIVTGFGDPGLVIRSRLNNLLGGNAFNNQLKTAADIENIRNIGANFTPHNTQVHTTTLHIHEGAVQLDARNLTTKESKQVMTNALEGLGEVEGVLTKKQEPNTTITNNNTNSLFTNNPIGG